jgi:hypothetical protein
MTFVVRLAWRHMTKSKVFVVHLSLARMSNETKKNNTTGPTAGEPPPRQSWPPLATTTGSAATATSPRSRGRRGGGPPLPQESCPHRPAWREKAGGEPPREGGKLGLERSILPSPWLPDLHHTRDAASPPSCRRG